MATIRRERSAVVRPARFVAAVLVVTGVVAGSLGLAGDPAEVLPVSSGQDPAACTATVALTNGGFEQPALSNGSYANWRDASVPGWSTTATDRLIELWRSYNGVPPGSGSQHVELNATQASMLYQDVPTTPGQTLRWELQHRGRAGLDTMAVQLGRPDGPLVSQGDLRDGTAAWGTHSGLYTVPPGQTTTRFGFEAVSTGSGNPTIGNFLDSISFGTGACVVTTTSVSTPTGAAGALVGDLLTYGVTAANGGGNPAQATVVTAQLLAGTSFVPGSIRAGTDRSTVAYSDGAGDDAADYDPVTRTVQARVGNGAGSATGGSVPAGESRTLSFQVRVDRSAAETTLVTAASTGFLDPLGGSRRTSTSNAVRTVVGAGADLAAEVEQVSGALLAGTPVEYRARLRSHGPSSAPGARLVLTLPAALAGVVATTPDGTCAGTAPTVTCDFREVPAAAERTVTLTGTVPAGAGAGTQQSVRATASSDVHDPVPGNDSATTSDSVVTSADLGVELAFAPADPVAGGSVTYTATVTNDGPSVARGIALVDPLRTGSTFVSATVAGGTCSMTRTTRTVECFLADLAPGASAQVVIEAVLAAAGDGSVDNAVSVSAATPDPVTADNHAAVASPGSVRADLSAALTVDAVTARPGDTVPFTLEVSNGGPSAAGNVSFTTVVPDGFTVVRPVSPYCTPTACTIPGLMPGQTVTISGTVEIGLDAEEGRGRASTTVISPTPDDDPADNTSVVDFDIVLEADLAVEVRAEDPGAAGRPLAAGGRVTTTGSVTNAGPTRAEAVQLRLGVPAGEPVPVTTTDAGSCVVEGSVVDGISNGGTLVCRREELPAGATWVVQFAGTVPAAHGDDLLVRRLAVATASPDPVPGNDTAVASVPVERRSDLAVARVTSTPQVVQSDVAAFRVTLTNHGPSDARDVLVHEVPRAGLTLTSVTADSGGYSAGEGLWRVPYLAAGRSAVLDAVGTVHLSGPLDSRSEIVAAGSADPDAGNDAAVAVVEVMPAERSLALTATPVVLSAADPGALVVGDSVTYTYRVVNDGNIDMVGVAVTDPVLGPATCPGTALAAGAAMTCASPGARTVTQDDFDTSDHLTGSATAWGTPAGESGGTSSGTALSRVPLAPAEPALEATEVADWDDADDDDALDAGETIDRSVHVVNTGDVTLVDLAVDDPVAGPVTCAALTLAPAAWTTCTAATRTVTTDDVALGRRDDSAVGRGTVLRTGQVVRSAATSTRTPSVARAALAVAPMAEGATGPSGTAAAGDTVRWRYVVRNHGNLPVTGVAVDDPEDGAVSCAAPDLLPGESVACDGSTRQAIGEAELLAGRLDREAVATGWTSAGTVRSDRAVGTVATAPLRWALDVGSTIEPIERAGARVTRTSLLRVRYSVTNAGNVSLTAIAVEDPGFGPVSCSLTALGPGQSTDCATTEPYEVTADDLADGWVRSAAVASAVPSADVSTTIVAAAAPAEVAIGGGDAGSARAARGAPAGPRVAGGPAVSPLASTGTDVGRLLGTAAGLIALGAVVLVLATRGRRTGR